MWLFCFSIGKHSLSKFQQLPQTVESTACIILSNPIVIIGSQEEKHNFKKYFSLEYICLHVFDNDLQSFLIDSTCRVE